MAAAGCASCARAARASATAAACRGSLIAPCVAACGVWCVWIKHGADTGRLHMRRKDGGPAARCAPPAGRMRWECVGGSAALPPAAVVLYDASVTSTIPSCSPASVRLQPLGSLPARLPASALGQGARACFKRAAPRHVNKAQEQLRPGWRGEWPCWPPSHSFMRIALGLGALSARSTRAAAAKATTVVASQPSTAGWHAAVV